MDDHSIPPEHQNRLSLRFVIDTHILDDGAGETDELWRLHRAGWFNLTRTDVLDTELRPKSDGQISWPGLVS